MIGIGFCTLNSNHLLIDYRLLSKIKKSRTPCHLNHQISPHHVNPCSQKKYNRLIRLRKPFWVRLKNRWLRKRKWHSRSPNTDSKHKEKVDGSESGVRAFNALLFVNFIESKTPKPQLLEISSNKFYFSIIISTILH